MTTPVLAVRVRRARANSACPMCNKPIKVHDSIAKVPDRAWSHTSCVVAANRRADGDGDGES